MNEEPRYNDIYYQRTTHHSQIIDIVQETAIALSEFRAPIDWQVLFDNMHPVEIDIGSGKGRFLLEASRQHPKVNYLGVERARKYVDLTRERFKKYMRHFSVDKRSGTFANVRLAWTDANYFLTRYVPAESVQAYHIYFPDPWPKKRQRKRRIFRNHDFLSALTRTLTSDNGKLYIVTDYAEYFEEIQERLAAYYDDNPCKAGANTNPLHRVSLDSSGYEHIETNFEMKYLLKGRPIYRAVYEKM